jgi:preprotein translocase subunit Sss1
MAETNYKVAENFKATVKLYSGEEIEVDMMKISIQEWKSVIKVGVPDEEEYKIISKVTGLELDKISKLPQPDYKLIVDLFVKLGTQQVTNPT